MCTNFIAITNPTAERLFKPGLSVKIYDQRLRFDSLYAVRKYFIRNFGECSQDKKIQQQNIYNLTHNVTISVNDVDIPCFIACKCGKCSECRDERRRNYSARATIEAADNPHIIFYTLTYDDAHLPDCGLNRSDVVKFHKRFRERLARWYSSKFNVSIEYARERTQYRTFYAGEYGTNPLKTRRPHYHGLFFFKNPFFYEYISAVYEIFKMCWTLCDWDTLECYKSSNPKNNFSAARACFQVARSPKAAARYITKYITKLDNQSVPDGKNPLFVQGPVKGGSLGCSNLDTHVSAILNSSDGTFKVSVKGDIATLGIPKNLLQKIYPSLSRDFVNISTDSRQLKYALDKLYPLIPDDSLYSTQIVGTLDTVIAPRNYLFKSLDNTLAIDSEFTSYVDNLARQNDVHKMYSFLMYLMGEYYHYPTEDEFIDKYLSNLRYISHLKRKKLTFEEYHKIQSKLYYQELNYVNNNLMNDDYLPF
ncbi:replication initiator protein [Peromfec virus RodF7_9]|uniref:Replication initiator protein n=1 Tax=Peromfec virus RodF7_9 TaxID=2929356 RepID=A0A976N314_9VIRU|nr:replication initiator protein [Peromfec virus RodF7_9]